MNHHHHHLEASLSILFFNRFSSYGIDVGEKNQLHDWL
jgi:hypothetical protein